MTALTMGERLKDLRTSKKLSLQTLHELVGMSASTLGAYENDLKNPSVELIKRLADYYDVSLDYLTGRTEISNPQIDIQAICSKTGLAQETVQFLMCNDKKSAACEFVNQLLGYDFLNWILDAYAEYKEIKINPNGYFEKVEMFENAIREIQNPLALDIAGRHNVEDYVLFKFQQTFLDFIKSVGDKK